MIVKLVNRPGATYDGSRIFVVDMSQCHKENHKTKCDKTTQNDSCRDKNGGASQDEDRMG